MVWLLWESYYSLFRCLIFIFRVVNSFGTQGGLWKFSFFSGWKIGLGRLGIVFFVVLWFSKIFSQFVFVIEEIYERKRRIFKEIVIFLLLVEWREVWLRQEVFGEVISVVFSDIFFQDLVVLLIYLFRFIQLVNWGFQYFQEFREEMGFIFLVGIFKKYVFYCISFLKIGSRVGVII